MQLRRRPASSTSPAGSVIGQARIKSVEYSSGVHGTASAVYNLYLYNVTMTSTNVFESARSIYDSASPNRFADIVLNSLGRAVLKETAYDKLLWKLPYDGIKTLRDTAGNIETGYEFRKEFTASFTANTAAVITTPDTLETFSGTSELTEIQKNRNYMVIPTTTGETANLNGTVIVAASSKNVVGTSTTFTTRFNVGDIIRIRSEDFSVASIANNTHLTLNKAHTLGANANNYTKLFPAGVSIALSGVGSNATANRGGGGGGGWNASDNGVGGIGGSGVVILTYAGSQVATGGTVTTSGGNTTHTFTSSSVFYTGIISGSAKPFPANFCS